MNSQTTGPQIYRDVYHEIATFLKPMDVVRYLDPLCKDSHNLSGNRKDIIACLQSGKKADKFVKYKNINFVLEYMMDKHRVNVTAVFKRACKTCQLGLVKHISEKYPLASCDYTSATRYAINYKHEKLFDWLHDTDLIDSNSLTSGFIDSDIIDDIKFVAKIFGCIYNIYGKSNIDLKVTKKLLCYINDVKDIETKNDYIKYVLSLDVIDDKKILRMMRCSKFKLHYFLVDLLSDNWIDSINRSRVGNIHFIVHSMVQKNRKILCADKIIKICVANNHHEFITDILKVCKPVSINLCEICDNCLSDEDYTMVRAIVTSDIICAEDLRKILESIDNNGIDDDTLPIVSYIKTRLM